MVYTSVFVYRLDRGEMDTLPDTFKILIMEILGHQLAVSSVPLSAQK